MYKFWIYSSNIVQQKISSTVTGFILSLEPIFSGIFGYIILKEQLTIQQYIGGALLFLCVIYVSKEI
nr:EamA family transporter [Fusobacterium necrophorum]